MSSYTAFFQAVAGNIADHILVFMAVGLTSNIEASIGYFGTRNATADILMYYLWESVDYLETVCGLRVSNGIL